VDFCKWRKGSSVGGMGRINPLADEPPGTVPFNFTYYSH
jgi:hypothetical protein